MIFDIDGIGNGVIGSLIVAAVQYTLPFLVTWLFNKIQRRRKKPPLNPAKVSIFVYILFLLSISVFAYHRFDINELSLIILPLMLAVFLNIGEIIFLSRILIKYSRFGIISLDKSAKQGLNYKKSLLNTNYKLDFIGVGARKLTSNDTEFSDMVKRVTQQGHEVRLILSHPQNKSLINLSTRADSSEDQYATKVKNSLKKIAQLKKDEYKIRVRFYKADSIDDMQIFRLMIIDDNYCLVTYSQFNDSSHIGDELPQLHLKKTNQEELDKTSLFNGFQKYFKQTWDSLEEWDYEDYL